MERAPDPLVVQYLYVHERGEAFDYPTVRASSSAARVATRYLECAVTQAASLRLQDARCEQALVTNVKDRTALGAAGAELLRCIEELGVHVLPTPYAHRPAGGSDMYVSSRYVLDAILAAGAGQPPERQLWLTDLDCVWARPERVFAAAPPAGEIGCVHIGYPPDWNAVGFDSPGNTRSEMGAIAARMGGPDAPPPWIGGELLGGTAGALRTLVSACEELDRALAADGQVMETEEQILTLAGATGAARFRDLSAVARRMKTGPRSQAPDIEDPLSIGLWHLPSEKGLSLRRAARLIRGGRTERLRRDFADPGRAARRFNVAGTGLARRVRDDGWIAAQLLRGAALAARWGR